MLPRNDRLSKPELQKYKGMFDTRDKTIIPSNPTYLHSLIALSTQVLLTSFGQNPSEIFDREKKMNLSSQI